MTRKDLVDYLQAYGCEMQPLSEFASGNAIKFYNPSTRKVAYIYTPIDDRKMYPATICHICVTLGIEVPNYAQDAKPIINRIQKDFPRKKKD